MKKNYRQVIRLICVGVLFVAVLVVLVHKGAIPRFWEQTAEVMQPAEQLETIEIPGPQEEKETAQEENAQEPAAADTPQSDEQVQPVADSTQAPEKENDVQTAETEQEEAQLSSEELLNAYLAKIQSQEQTKTLPQALQTILQGPKAEKRSTRS